MFNIKVEIELSRETKRTSRRKKSEYEAKFLNVQYRDIWKYSYLVQYHVLYTVSIKFTLLSTTYILIYYKMKHIFKIVYSKNSCWEKERQGGERELERARARASLMAREAWQYAARAGSSDKISTAKEQSEETIRKWDKAINPQNPPFVINFCLQVSITRFHNHLKQCHQWGIKYSIHEPRGEFFIQSSTKGYISYIFAPVITFLTGSE